GGRRAPLRAMLESGEITEVEVEGRAGRWLALTRDLPALAWTRRASASPTGTTLLAPFDSLLWYRGRVARLFGFDYRIEVYTPGHKRVHGYYSLPILHDGLLIGRLDAKNHREQRRLEVRSVHFEPWFSGVGRAQALRRAAPDRAAALEGLGEALRDLAAFVGAESVALGRVAPRVMAGALRSELRRGV